MPWNWLDLMKRQQMCPMPSLFDTPLDESVQVLKRVLPLMSEQRVPTIPQNYAVWFDYVTKRNEDLTAEIEQRIQNGSDFDPSSCRTIYEKYFISELQTEVDGIQGAVREAVESVLMELDGATTLATAGYTGEVVTLRRRKDGWQTEVVAVDDGRLHHLAAGDIEGIGPCLVTCGYSGRLLVAYPR